MSILHVRNIPDDLYQRIQRRAEAQGRSITAEVVSLLERAIADADMDQAQVLAGIRRRRFFSPAEAGAPDSTALLREDRQR
jgi:plasmid stability protein